jgi:hypothetical protein
MLRLWPREVKDMRAAVTDRQRAFPYRFPRRADIAQSAHIYHAGLAGATPFLKEAPPAELASHQW